MCGANGGAETRFPGHTSVFPNQSCHQRHMTEVILVKVKRLSLSRRLCARPCQPGGLPIYR